MKTISHSLLFIALVASGNVFAQDPHADHAGHDDPSAAAVDPHAGHVMPKAKPAAQNHDAHAGHAGHAAATPAAKADPHAAHRGHAGHGKKAADPHAAHQGQTASDPHAGHVMPMAATEAHSEQRAKDDASLDPHAGHLMPMDAHAVHAMHGNGNTPREPIPTPTAEDFAVAFPVLQPHAMEHAPAFNNRVVFDHLEAWDNAHGSGQVWGIDAWFGNDIDRLWLRSEGERSDSHLGSWSIDALYGHSISPWWDVVAGVRHDGGDDLGLTRAAFGFQGMAPYKFEISATAYIGGPRKAELALEVEYDVLLTNRLILQPVIEASISADDDPRRGVGSGLGHVEAGLRLRYEITRQFAPYVGFTHERLFGRTADLHRDAGEGVSDSRWVAGVRFWF